ncbi:hypothetical protein L6452_37136 [Arctium lappa]|uniref:Uncharacterized protein n=1 Tax=Arctium lappa TaxID=4217 RepID=A0ACB8Y6B1_ARCLA|nr:hypothetical protein L6452_37136 [Arctium lappa]
MAAAMRSGRSIDRYPGCRVATLGTRSGGSVGCRERTRLSQDVGKNEIGHRRVTLMAAMRRYCRGLCSKLGLWSLTLANSWILTSCDIRLRSTKEKGSGSVSFRK